MVDQTPHQHETDPQATVISAIALRVRDADAAYQHAVAMGVWAIKTRAGVMELNIPGIHGAGDSILYFVDRFRDFSIYDVSKRTELYSFLNYMKNQTNAGFRFSGSAGPSANLAGVNINGQGLLGFQAGILHRF